jgi:hypothetical protein
MRLEGTGHAAEEPKSVYKRKIAGNAANCSAAIQRVVPVTNLSDAEIIGIALVHVDMGDHQPG